MAFFESLPKDTKVPASARGKTVFYFCDFHGADTMVGELDVGTLPVKLESFDVD